MGGRVSFARKCWRAFLRGYYAYEHGVMIDPKRLERWKRLFSLLPVRNNKVVVNNFCGKGYGENAKYIVEELLRRPRKYKIIWMVDEKREGFPQGVRPVPYYSLRAYFESATAKVWIFNSRNCRLTEKKECQIYLQTWHGGIAIKKIEKDAEEKLSQKYVDAAKEDGRVTDGILADGSYIEDIYRRAFWLNDNCEILRFGAPRADVLCGGKEAEAIKIETRRKLGIQQDAYVVLYAPTFRNSGTTEGYINDLEAVREAFARRHKNAAILVRLHPNVARTASDLQYGFSNMLINVTDYADQQELIITSDCVITDYSSIIYDFALMRKPGFLCMKDVDAYVAERGVYDFFYDQPFQMNYQENELVEEITNFNEDGYQIRLDAFFNKYPSYNTGKASKKTVDWLISKGLS